MSLQQEIIERLGVKSSINVDEEIEQRVRFLKENVKSSRATGLLIAISGGLDSAVAAGLCKRATDELTEETGKEYITLGVFQPYGDQEDIGDSYETAKVFGLTHTLETSIEDTVDEIALEVEHAMKSLGQFRHLSIPGKGNVKARARMVMQYALSFELNLLVVGTDHASESIAGFYTKWGDGAADLMPLSSLNKRQIQHIAAALGVPESIINKAPTAGLWAGQNDELELGVSYEDNSDYLEGKSVDPAIQKRLESHYLKTEHKRNPIPRK
ncbi:ammonia-dependent NAD(+) synthetase [Paenibacillus lentus]|uniref:NH(3)-dependent NAD(+) synthetase n=1 Tax=Paenibacillus lentus TaxID=1338368 RepID=A0A3S8S0K4_9BACL|nr:ammonia-dependent NAD(+) synthetase [Paenibacillus lentus]AZK48801.1 ammonia-dependent NAD(+) synthetase [Paenibacillus lentus]